MKREYENPIADITYFGTEDIMNASQPGQGGEDGDGSWE